MLLQSRTKPELQRRRVLCALVFLTGSVNVGRAADSPSVTLLKTPDGGIQPQAVIDGGGMIHLIYFRGDPYHGDLQYTRRAAGAEAFESPRRVNNRAQTAIAVGTIRGGQLALGRSGRTHVVWNGALNVRDANATHDGAALFYSCRNAMDDAFQPQRDLIQRTSALDGGGTVAADAKGRVYALWHGRAADAPKGEAGRTLWIVRSEDDGATFTAEQPAVTGPTGACACCSTRALAAADGTLYALYRAATGNVERDMRLVVSRDHGTSFDNRSLQPWPISTCPMSSESLYLGATGSVLAAWETKGQVSFARVTERSQTISPPGPGIERKHPAIAANAQGEILLAWTEGTGWQKGGDLAWQVFDAHGRPTAVKGRVRGGIPVWSLPTALARPDGRFVIVH